VDLCTVDENETIGGSDHRPVRFHLNINTDALQDKHFIRCDIRKLDRLPIKGKFLNALDENFNDAKTMIQNEIDRCHGLLSYEKKCDILTISMT
jgi:hypothetical protein